MSSLAELPAGTVGQVASLPHHHGLARRLIALGLTPGAEVRVLQNRGRGPLIVEAHGARIALGRRQADRVTVEMASDEPVSIDAAGRPAATGDPSGGSHTEAAGRAGSDVIEWITGGRG